MRGEAIGNSETIRTVHNSFSRPEPFIMEEKAVTSDDDEVYHFVGYVPVDGAVYELDGLKPGPVLIGSHGDGDWIDVVRPAIQSRIQAYSEQEVRFNLLAIIDDRLDTANKSIANLEAKNATINARLGGDNSAGAGELPDSPDALQALLSSNNNEIQNLRNTVADEQDKRQMWKEENVRRKHNYVPFVFNLIEGLAKAGKLAELREAGLKAANDKMEAARQRKAKESQN